MTTNSDYPPCTNPACGYTLCFMERRDLDACPACETSIPVELQLDDEFQPLAP